MQKHYEREVADLIRHLDEQLSRVRTNARVALNLPAASQENDDFIPDSTLDKNEVLIEEECLKIIALHQPVADELRFLTTIIKTNYNLERIGDLLKKIHNLRLDHHRIHRELGDPGMGLLALFARVEETITDACDSLASRDDALARRVWAKDQQVDKDCKALMAHVRAVLKERPATDSLLDALLCCRYAERLADHSANIAKEVLYLVTGEIVRHRRKEVLGES